MYNRAKKILLLHLVLIVLLECIRRIKTRNIQTYDNTCHRDITSTKKLTFMTSYNICPSVSSAAIFNWELPAFERSHHLAHMLKIRLSSLKKPFTTSIGRRYSPPCIYQITGTIWWLFKCKQLSTLKIESEVNFCLNLSISEPCQVCLFAVRTPFLTFDWIGRLCLSNTGVIVLKNKLAS